MASLPIPSPVGFEPQMSNGRKIAKRNNDKEAPRGDAKANSKKSPKNSAASRICKIARKCGGIPSGAKQTKYSDNQSKEAEERLSLNNEIELIPSLLYQDLLKLVDLQSVSILDEKLAKEWVIGMATIQAETGYITILSNYPRLQQFESQWKAAYIAAKKMLVKSGIEEQKGEDKEEEVEEAATTIIENSNQISAKPNIDFVGLLLPLRFAMSSADVEKILSKAYDDAELVKKLIEFMERYHTGILGILGSKESAISQAMEMIAKTPPAVVPVMEKVASTEPIRGFNADAAKDFIQRIPPNEPKSAKAIDIAAKIATLMLLNVNIESLNLIGPYRVIWDNRSQIVSTLNSATALDLLTSVDVEQFLREMETLLDADTFRNLLDKYHVMYGLDGLFDNGKIGVRSLASLYMRAEGAGKLVKKDGCSYWLDEENEIKIRKNGRIKWENWHKFQTRVSTVLCREIKSRIITLDRSVENVQSAANHSDEIGMLQKILRHIDSTGMLNEICLCCVDLEVEIKTKLADNERRFPKISEQIERVLLIVCDDFGGDQAELANDVYVAYIDACRTEKPQFSSCNTFCRELYKQRDKFKQYRHNNHTYIAGLHLKLSKFS